MIARAKALYCGINCWPRSGPGHSLSRLFNGIRNSKQLQEAMEVLHQTMESDSVSEQQALIQLDKVLDVEREIKRLHIGMGIRLKNQLAPAQQEKLHAIAMASRPAEQRP